MSRHPLRVLTPLLCCLPLLAAGCGGSSSSSSSGKGNTGVSQGQKKGGTLKVLSNSDFDNIDPGIAYYQFSYEYVTAAHRTLYQYKPDQIDKPSPDLAASEPVISKDKKTVTVKLKKGIRFSPPVNREVQAKDVKYAIERGFSKQVAAGYVGSYFGSLVGAPKEPGDFKPIPGIQTPDPHTLVFKLSQPVAGTLVGALVLTITAPVPQEYARKFDSKTPSQYGTHQVTSGPYMYDHDKSGKLTYKPGKSVVLVRNPNWDPKTDFRPAYVDRIEGQIGADVNVAGRQILRNSNAVSGDTPSAPIVKLGVQRYPKQISFTSGQGNRYIAFNTQIKPFDDVNVRRAAYAAMDRDALRRTRGGKSVGDIATHFIQPGLPGYKEAGGAKGPDLDFNASTRPNLKVAAKYLKKAGFKSGKYSGPKILMVGDNEPPADKTAQIVLQGLRSIGFNVSFRLVSHDTMYSAFCNVPKKKVQVCPNVGFVKDFNDPLTMVKVPFDGRSISSSNNSNWPQLDDPKINAMIDKGERKVSVADRAKAFGAVDRAVVATAAAVPWLWDKQPNVESKNVKGVIDQWNAAYNLAFTSVK
jgi:peptide/nickel transport system substrate-binding protein